MYTRECKEHFLDDDESANMIKSGLRESYLIHPNAYVNPDELDHRWLPKFHRQRPSRIFDNSLELLKLSQGK